MVEDDQTDEMNRTELDSHANMVVLGQGALILNNTGKTAEVSAFTPEVDALNGVPLVDAAVLYLCLYTGKKHILVFFNALHVPKMRNNLVPPFLMREAEINVNDKPKIHCNDPGEMDHCIYWPQENVQIPLSL